MCLAKGKIQRKFPIKCFVWFSEMDAFVNALVCLIMEWKSDKDSEVLSSIHIIYSIVIVTPLLLSHYFNIILLERELVNFCQIKIENKYILNKDRRYCHM